MNVPATASISRIWLLAAAAVLVTVIVYEVRYHGRASPSLPAAAPAGTPPSSVEITDLQARQIRIEAVARRPFAEHREAAGYLDFNQDRTVQVYPPVPGRITRLAAEAGEDVAAGQVLYAIASPDLAAAESALVAAAATRALTRAALARAQALYPLESFAQKDLEQAQSDAKSAEGAYEGARATLRAFGRSDAEIDRLAAGGHGDGTLTVASPVRGRVAQRVAAPGALVQPGTAPAPYTVADLSTLWLVAGVAETDAPYVRPGQPVVVRLPALPGREFHAKVSYVSPGIDPTTHRATVRAEIADPGHELKAQMLASFTIQTGAVHDAPALPVGGVVREGDGSMTVWVTTDRHRFTKRTVELGLDADGYVELRAGVKPGELAATDGALFLSNALVEASR